MPPHCDSLDGPVVTAARRALAENDSRVVLPYVPVVAEDEVSGALELAARARDHGPEASEVADRWFFETVVRLHRAGEGAPFTGLKPAGLDVGPAIPEAERALETGSADRLADLLCATVREQAASRLADARELRAKAGDDGVAAARESVEAALGLQVWAHGVYRQVIGPAHGHGAAHGPAAEE